MADGGHATYERARLDAVRRYDILDTPPDGAFERVTKLAARFCGAPISTISIVDEDRIWFKSAHGLSVDEVGRDPGLCASAILHDDPHIVTDAIEDPRTLNNPLVRGELGLRYYVGIPLRTSDGYTLGTLNVIDVEPREPTEAELETLRDLAAVVMDELELRLAARRTVELEAARKAADFRESLLAGISHEMRTRTSILNGVVNLEPDDEFDEDARRTMIRRHVRQLDWLINQYLDFTGIEGGRDPAVTPERVDVAELAREAQDVFAADAAIDLRVDDPLPSALADPDRTRQILIELLNNAIRFSPPDAPVTVEVQRRDGNTVSVNVTDQGPGIHPDDHGPHLRKAPPRTGEHRYGDRLVRRRDLGRGTAWPHRGRLQAGGGQPVHPGAPEDRRRCRSLLTSPGPRQRGSVPAARRRA